MTPFLGLPFVAFPPMGSAFSSEPVHAVVTACHVLSGFYRPRGFIIVIVIISDSGDKYMFHKRLIQSFLFFVIILICFASISDY